MTKNDFSYEAKDGTTIYAQSWSTSTEPKAIVQIAHGMAEHIDRYDEFARELVKNDFSVYGNDHRGHGKTAGTKENLGYFADEDGFSMVVEDMHQLTLKIREVYPTAPIILFGHSMGSFLARKYIQVYGGELTGVILSGTGGDPGFLGKMGLLLAKNEAKRKGAKTPSPLLDKLAFGNFNKPFKPARSDFDWLSRDQEAVEKYIQDPLCGNISSAGFFQDLFEGLMSIHKPAEIRKTPKDLPIFLLSGSKDPVGNNSKGVLQVYQSYLQAGIKDITYKLYEDGRHEMLNEINKHEVYEDIINWITLKIGV